MEIRLIKDVLDLLQRFEEETGSPHTVQRFKQWINAMEPPGRAEPEWEGKEEGRSPESVISTLLVHINRYAKNYSRAAIFGSDLATQEDFIYLINLKAFGEMSKMQLIKKNVHEKSTGMQIINRLITNGWVNQADSATDRRSKVIYITEEGRAVLENQMTKIRKATEIVAGNLNHTEKMELIRLLQKLDTFHQPFYHQQIEIAELLDAVKLQ